MNYYAIVKLNLVGGASEFILDALSLSKNKRIQFQLLIGKLRTGKNYRIKKINDVVSTPHW